MKKQYILYPILMIFISAAFIFSIYKKGERAQTLELYDVFDTYSVITVVSQEDKSEVLALCHEYLKEKDTLWSLDNPKSEIYALNNASGKSYVTLSLETIDILKKSQDATIKTKGFFDITTGAIIDLWGIGKNPKVPSAREIFDAIGKTGAELLKIDQTSSSAKLIKEGTSVNLGAIAKGYATKKIIDILKDNNVSSALVNLGGNTYALGHNYDGKLWRIGIQDPKNNENLIGTLSVSNTSVITSGNYFRYFEKDGVRYHHIMNPFTGRPSDSGLTSVTIINSDPIIADVLSTACFVIGYEDSLPLIKDTNSQAVFVTEDNMVYYSKTLDILFEYDNPLYEYKTF